ncbi:hypothetical protein [Deinococcus cellulosilyticus]|uniref:Uncharacterized protein n=1 Tax=Deinococcus cellulosilyticus (strain DSM 18568 / NBRC 106333 / KACC 11606 / 5516J-15) TaxID=1223518 RepID=A0A511MY97_DEIC1|nr:hypothetical protein [Deinococcus cellulosilyticus]GEM45565.1 hypothetical protein DC3_12000 [Deinococcus cellulosilyticus NBRC 106333 = KACC 11606]
MQQTQDRPIQPSSEKLPYERPVLQRHGNWQTVMLAQSFPLGEG